MKYCSIFFYETLRSKIQFLLKLEFYTKPFRFFVEIRINKLTGACFAAVKINLDNIYTNYTKLDNNVVKSLTHP